MTRVKKKARIAEQNKIQRLRIIFGPRCVPIDNSELRKRWVRLPEGLRQISDISHFLSSLCRPVQGSIQCSLEGWQLPPNESIEILREDDIICVKCAEENEIETIDFLGNSPKSSSKKYLNGLGSKIKIAKDAHDSSFEPPKKKRAVHRPTKSKKRADIRISKAPKKKRVILGISSSSSSSKSHSTESDSSRLPNQTQINNIQKGGISLITSPNKSSSKYSSSSSSSSESDAASVPLKSKAPMPNIASNFGPSASPIKVAQFLPCASKEKKIIKVAAKSEKMNNTTVSRVHNSKLKVNSVKKQHQNQPNNKISFCDREHDDFMEGIAAPELPDKPIGGWKRPYSVIASITDPILRTTDPLDMADSYDANQFPSVGDRIAFRTLTLSESTWTPELSEYKVGEILVICDGQVHICVDDSNSESKIIEEFEWTQLASVKVLSGPGLELIVKKRAALQRWANMT